MAGRTSAELEALIGQPSFQGKAAEAAIAQLALGTSYQRISLIQWLIAKGIPAKSANAALPNSIAAAYCNQPYLSAWRKRLNPRWADINNAFDLSEGRAAIDTGEAVEAAADEVRAIPTVDLSEVADKAAAQLLPTIERFVEASIKRAKLLIGDDAKEAIRKIAVETAASKVAELMPPQKLEVVQPSGKVVSLGLQHSHFPRLLRAMQARDHRGFKLNIWLTGPTGSGKTSAAEAASKALSLPFGSDGSLDADYKVMGFRDANGNVVSTQFLGIFENGGIYVADEIDNWLPSALLSLNAALANGGVSCPKGMVKRHVDACIIACANTWGLGATSDYVGRTKLDAASLDRFQPKIEWPIDESLERAVATEQFGAKGIEWFLRVKAARDNAKRQGLKVIISPRATFSGIALLQAGFSHAEVTAMTLAAGLSPEQVKSIGISDASYIRFTSTKDADEDGLEALA
ncbi:MAG: hypothetical protein ACREHV_06425 [Rhizomicrobium sp.]